MATVPAKSACGFDYRRARVGSGLNFMGLVRRSVRATSGHQCGSSLPARGLTFVEHLGEEPFQKWKGTRTPKLSTLSNAGRLGAGALCIRSHRPMPRNRRLPDASVWWQASSCCTFCCACLLGGARDARLRLENKCTRRDSNPQPSVPKTDALSIELRVPGNARTPISAASRWPDCNPLRQGPQWPPTRR